MLKVNSRRKLIYVGSAAITVASAIALYQNQTRFNSIVLNDSPEDSSLDALPVKKVKKAKLPMLPPTEFGPNYPGVYAWGNNSGNVVAPGYGSTLPVVKTPYRIPYFDGRLLRDLALGERLGVAVLENGDVVQWGDAFSESSSQLPEKTIKGRNIAKVEVAEGKAVYGLNKNGSSVYAWPLARKDLVGGPKLGTSCAQGGSWWKIWTWGGTSGGNDGAAKAGTCLTVKVPSLGFREYIKDIRVGNDHILVLTSKGRVFSGSTGVYPDHKPASSRGQYGIAALSQFDEAPLPGSVYEIKSFRDTMIAQIAAGDYHSVARTTQGQVYVFGENVLGQLGLPYSYSTANAAVPTLLPFHKLYSRRLIPECSDIAAGGSTTFVTINPKPNPHELLDRSKDVSPTELSRDIYAFGSGLVGQLGTGAFVHAQSNPVRVKHFANLAEYSESLRKMVQIDLSNWSIGKTHATVAVGSDSRALLYGKDLLIWGGNEFAQIGTGKRNNIPKPSLIPSLTIDRLNTITTTNNAEKEDNEWLKNDMQNDRLQLIHDQKVQYVDPMSHSHKSAHVSQVAVAGNNNTAVYFKRV